MILKLQFKIIYLFNQISKLLKFASLVILLFSLLILLHVINVAKDKLPSNYQITDQIELLNKKIISNSKNAYVITHPKCDDTNCEIIVETNVIKYKPIKIEESEFNSNYNKLKKNQHKLKFKKELLTDIKLNSQIKYSNWDGDDYITEINHKPNKIALDIQNKYPTLKD